jgi:hypothetical protein
MNDHDVLDLIRGSLSNARLQLPVETIVLRGRRARRRRRTAVGTAVTVAAVVGLTSLGSLLTTPNHSGSPDLLPVAFTVVTSSDGTATLTLLKGRPLDPDALRAKLGQAGVPAMVTEGQLCENQVGDSAALDRVVAPEQRPDGTVVLVITPAAMPQGTELSIGIFPSHREWTLVTANAPLTCRS